MDAEPTAEPAPRTEERWVVDGLDPGKDGGLVRLSGDARSAPLLEVALSWRLKRSSNTYTVDRYRWGAVDKIEVAHPEELGEALFARAPDVLMTEDVFVGQNKYTSLDLARSAQAVTSGLQCHWPVRVPERRLMEQAWRAALYVSRSRRGVPDPIPDMMRRGVQGLDEVGPRLGKRVHIYDAAALAYVGLFCRCWYPDWLDKVRAGTRALNLFRAA